MRSQPSKGRYFPLTPAEFVMKTRNWTLAEDGFAQPRELLNPSPSELDGHALAKLRLGRAVILYSLPNSIDVDLGRRAALKALELVSQWMTQPQGLPGHSRSIVAYLFGERQLRVFDEQLRYARGTYRMGDKFSHAFKPRVTHRSTTELATIELD